MTPETPLPCRYHRSILEPFSCCATRVEAVLLLNPSTRMLLSTSKEVSGQRARLETSKTVFPMNLVEKSGVGCGRTLPYTRIGCAVGSVRG